MLAYGDILAGKYRVERTIGEGGFGVVVEAEHLVLRERVAIKVLKPELASSERVVARFVREARAAARMRGEHVARVLDVGMGDAPYIVMEQLRGHDLARLVATRGALPIEAAVDHILQTLLALAEAHGLGIVHRDIKPSNLFVSARPDGSSCIKVLDFGIAKAMPNAGEGIAITQTQDVVGTPLYMAPEQMRSAKSVDGRTDIWSVGATLYELLAGRPAFNGPTLSDIYALVLTEAPPLLAAARPDVPPALVAIVMRCLEKSPARRFADVRALAAALAPFGSGRVPVPALGAETGAADLGGDFSGNLPPVADTMLAIPAGRTVPLGMVSRGRGRSSAGTWLAATCLLLVLVAAVFVVPRARAAAAAKAPLPATTAAAVVSTPEPLAASSNVTDTAPALVTTEAAALPTAKASRPVTKTAKKPAAAAAAPVVPAPVVAAQPPPPSKPVVEAPALASAPSSRGVATTRFE